MLISFPLWDPKQSFCQVELWSWNDKFVYARTCVKPKKYYSLKHFWKTNEGWV